MINERKLSPEELNKREEIIKSIITNNRHALVKKYGKDAEKVVYGRATNMIKKQSKEQIFKDKVRDLVTQLINK
jgi:hypothetical protein